MDAKTMSLLRLASPEDLQLSIREDFRQLNSYRIWILQHVGFSVNLHKSLEVSMLMWLILDFKWTFVLSDFLSSP